jgi:hypothetical protein
MVRSSNGYIVAVPSRRSACAVVMPAGLPKVIGIVAVVRAARFLSEMVYLSPVFDPPAEHGVRNAMGCPRHAVNVHMTITVLVAISRPQPATVCVLFMAFDEPPHLPKAEPAAVSFRRIYLPTPD